MGPEQKRTLSKIRHVALDMDGTIYLGDTLFPYTVPFLERLDRLGITYSFLTNNPSSSRKAYLDKLRGMGVPSDLSRIYTTIELTISYLRTELPGVRRLYILGTPSMTEEFIAAGYEPVDDNPEAVVVAFDRTLVYERLCRAAWWIKAGLPYIATNPDLVCPTNQPTVLVDCGSICACLEKATGRRPDVTLGKPDPNFVLSIARDHSISAPEIAVVGDRLYTDIASGINAGALSVLVLSGETDLEMARRSEIRPDVIVNDIDEFGHMLEDSLK